MDVNKKKPFFCVSDWTDWVLLAILNALFVWSSCANGADEADNKGFIKDHKLAMQKNCDSSKFIEKKQNRFADDDVYQRLVISVCEAMQYSAAGNYNKERLQQDVNNLMSEGADLARQVLTFVKYMEALLEADKQGTLRYIQTKMMLDDLKQQALKMVIKTSAKFRQNDTCRILEKNGDLNVVVLTYGATHGVRSGLKWFVQIDANEQAVLKTVAVRPYVCAAVVESGSFDKLLPGMAADTENKMKFRK